MILRTRTAEVFRSNRWFKLVWIIPIVIGAMVVIVIAAKVFRATDAGISFLHDFSGHSGLPSFAPVGFPEWLNWQHGLNAFFIIYIVRFGWQVRTTKRPTAFWTRNNNNFGRTQGSPVRISIDLWAHISIDILWMVNGVVFYALIFSTGQWARIVPTRWDIVPNAISAGIQYASLSWPTETGWSNYNALQTIIYFMVVFIAAPVTVITGIRMAPGFANKFTRIDNVFPLPVARAIHYPTMIFFVVFIIIHVVLVLTTGALNNLNHMYAGNNDYGWVGFIIFAASIVLTIAVWIALRPVVLRTIAGTMGKVGR